MEKLKFDSLVIYMSAGGLMESAILMGEDLVVTVLSAHGFQFRPLRTMIFLLLPTAWLLWIYIRLNMRR